MSESNKPSHLSIDELLAAYADQIQASQDPIAVPFGEGKQLEQLQKTVKVLHQQAVIDLQPGAAERIKPQVAEVWKQEYQLKARHRDRQFNKRRKKEPVYQSATRRRQLAALRITAAAAVVILAALIFLPGIDISGGMASGAAAGEINSWLGVGALVLLGGVGLWWWLTSRRK